uniref:Uncharacterized protein n=1 Tax=Oryza glaberrima TaxID=4538 RepID=I1NYY2_ORYGL
WRWINASTKLDQTLSLKLQLLERIRIRLPGDEVVDDEVAGRLPGHLPQLDGAELDADRHARPHRERHEPGLLLLQQLRRHRVQDARRGAQRDGEDEHGEQRPAHATAAPPPTAPAPTPTGWIW